MNQKEANIRTLMEMINGFDKLSGINRYCHWDRIKEMNVGEHSFRVAILAMTIADSLKLEGHVVNVEKVMRIALLHDYEESLNGDISYTVKNANEKNRRFFDELEESTILEHMFNARPEYKAFALRAHISIEDEIIDIADMFELLTYTSREMALGNTSMLPLLEKGVEYIHNLCNKYGIKKYDFVVDIADSIHEYAISKAH